MPLDDFSLKKLVISITTWLSGITHQEHCFNLRFFLLVPFRAGAKTGATPGAT
jgi:hypothetical protein